MYKRLELHNHTTESDSSLSPLELIRFMESNQVDAFALTDHNTISGHQKVKQLLEDSNSQMECIYGMEYTTYYGHILCFSLNEYVPFENINLHKPELLFQAAKAKGAVVGVAHPFSYGHPFSRGCRFDMTIKDYTSFDFIEVFNNPEPLHEVNEKGLLWWEDLILKGAHLAATCGMDLHGKMDMNGQYATFILEKTGENITEALKHAILSEKVHISKGPVIEANEDTCHSGITLQLVDTHKPGYDYCPSKPYIITVKNNNGTLVRPLDQQDHLFIPLDELDKNGRNIVKLYEGTPIIENLIAIAPVIDFNP